MGAISLSCLNAETSSFRSLLRQRLKPEMDNRKKILAKRLGKKKRKENEVREGELDGGEREEIGVKFVNFKKLRILK